MVILKPVSGPGASGVSHKALLNEIVGKKQAISYFLNDNELCKVTVMVGDAFNGADVTDAAAVRFQVALGDGARARFDTAEGNSLEFVCREHAQVLTVKLGRRVSAAPVRTSVLRWRLRSSGSV
jgi:hypothetical protein